MSVFERKNGASTFQVTCSDQTDQGLNGNELSLRVAGYTGADRLLKCGFIQVSANGWHFEYADGTRCLTKAGLQ